MSDTDINLPKEKTILDELGKEMHNHIIVMLDHFTIKNEIYLVFEMYQVS